VVILLPFEKEKKNYMETGKNEEGLKKIDFALFSGKLGAWKLAFYIWRNHFIS